MIYFEEIQKIVCDGEKLKPELLRTKTRKREIVYARQVVMWLLRKYSKKISWAKCSSYYAKDHATAMHAFKTINNLTETDSKIANDINLYCLKVEEIVNFEKNIITDRLCDIRERISVRIANNLPLTYELIMIYNNLIEKVEIKDP
jgi:S-adenosylhomocysteine hydrolase